MTHTITPTCPMDEMTTEPHGERMVLRTENLVKKYGKRTVANQDRKSVV